MHCKWQFTGSIDATHKTSKKSQKSTSALGIIDRVAIFVRHRLNIRRRFGAQVAESFHYPRACKIRDMFAFIHGATVRYIRTWSSNSCGIMQWSLYCALKWLLDLNAALDRVNHAFQCQVSKVVHSNGLHTLGASIYHKCKLNRTTEFCFCGLQAAPLQYGTVCHQHQHFQTEIENSYSRAVTTKIRRRCGVAVILVSLYSCCDLVKQWSSSATRLRYEWAATIVRGTSS